MRSEVYWNLHKHLYSLRALEGANKGRVVARESCFRMTNVKFVVQPAGRAKVLRDKTKNVHAFVRGTLAPVSMFDATEWQRVTYNPYKYSTFVNASTGAPIHSAKEVIGLSYEVDGRIIPKMWARV